MIIKFLYLRPILQSILLFLKLIYFVSQPNMNRQINSFTDRQRNLNWISIKQGNTSYNIPYKHFCYQQCIKKLKTDEVRAKIWRSKLK